MGWESGFPYTAQTQPTGPDPNTQKAPTNTGAQVSNGGQNQAPLTGSTLITNRNDTIAS